MSALAEDAELRPRRSRGPFEVLVLHLFACLFANDETETTTSPITLMLQVAGALGLPPFLITLVLTPSYSGLSPFMVPRPFWTQVQDHCFFILYSCAVVGIAALLKWEDFFPTLLDMRILGLMPIAPSKLFTAKVAATLMYLGVFLVGTNALTSVLLPSVASQQGRQFFAHILAVGVASCFTVTATLTLLSATTLLPGRIARLVGSLLQGVLIALLFALLVFSPLIAHLLRPLLTMTPAALVWFPPFWFVGIYEVVWQGSPQSLLFKPLAQTGLLATAVSSLTLAFLYPLAYRRRAESLLEDQARARVGLHRLPASAHRFLPPRLGLQPVSAAIFHLIGPTIFRVLRFRVTLILAASMGVAIAATIIGKLTLTTSRPFLQFLPANPVTMATAVLLLIAAGLYLCLSSAHEPKAAWLFESILGHDTREAASGIRRWMLLCSLAVAIAADFLQWLLVPSLRLPWSLLGQQLILITGVCLLVTDILTTSFRGLPFVPNPLRRQRTTASVLLFLFGFAPASLWLIGGIERLVAGSWLGNTLCLCCAGLIAQTIWHHHHNSGPQQATHQAHEYVQRLGL